MMRTIEITDSITMPCSAEQAWAVVADYSNDSSWRKGVRSMAAEPAGLVVPAAVTTEHLRLAGKTWVNIGEVVDVDTGRRFAWRTVSGADADGAREVASTGPDSCRVCLELRVRPHGVERVAAPVLERMLRRNLHADLVRLAELVVDERARASFDTTESTRQPIVTSSIRGNAAMTLIGTIAAAQAHGAAIRPAVGGFPYLAESLRQAGVTRIDVTVPSWTTVLTTAEGSVLQQGAPMVDGAAEVPPFDLDAFLVGLRGDQEGRLTFPEWMEATWRAGVLWYEVDLEARTCTYRAPAGGTYVEQYPAVDISDAAAS